jgi:hypothetical protein
LPFTSHPLFPFHFKIQKNKKNKKNYALGECFMVALQFPPEGWCAARGFSIADL